MFVLTKNCIGGLSLNVCILCSVCNNSSQPSWVLLCLLLWLKAGDLPWRLLQCQLDGKCGLSQFATQLISTHYYNNYFLFLYCVRMGQLQRHWRSSTRLWSTRRTQVMSCSMAIWSVCIYTTGTISNVTNQLFPCIGNWWWATAGVYGVQEQFTQQRKCGMKYVTPDLIYHEN